MQRSGLKITLLFSLSIFSVYHLFSQTCRIDSLQGQKYEYNDLGKLNRITEFYTGPFGDRTYYYDIIYNADSLLDSVIEYTIGPEGDTLMFPEIILRYEYTNGLLSKIIEGNYITGDLVYDEYNRIIEYKYFYLVDDTIDPSQTRVSNLIYSAGNVTHLLYKEISTGDIITSCTYSYDDKINPLYQTETGLIYYYCGLIGYSSKNNCSRCSGVCLGESFIETMTLTYNEYDYPLKIEYSSDNSVFYEENYAYMCDSTMQINTLEDKERIFLYPNPSSGTFFFSSEKSEALKEIRVFNLYGLPVSFHSDVNFIEIRNPKSGVYIIEITDNQGNTNRFKVMLSRNSL